jgi:DnaJ-class molecular chaperone
VGDVGATHYERLGVGQFASQAEIRAAYRSLARQNHPDLAGGPADGEMVAVNEAWRVLGDAERRAAYDATLPSSASKTTEPVADGQDTATTVDADDGVDDAEDWRLDLPITDGRAVRTFGLLVAVAGGLALFAVIALFTYAIFWSG